MIPVFFFIAAVAVMLPLLISPTDLQIMGGDIYHNIWVWSRNVVNIENGRYPWESNIYFPDELSSFYSEMDFGNSMIYGLLNLFKIHPIIIYLIILFLAFYFTGIFVSLISLSLGANLFGSLIGGTLAAFASYRYNHISHVQLLSIYWFLIPIYFFIKYVKSKNNKYLYLILIFNLLIFSGPSYNLFGYFWFLLAIITSYFIKENNFHKNYKFIIKISPFYIIPIVIMYPVWINYFELFKLGFSREASFAPLSMDIASLLAPPKNSLIYGLIDNFIASSGVRLLGINSFFIGFIATFLILFIYYIKFFKSKVEVFKDENLIFVNGFLVISVTLLLISLGEVIRWNDLFLMPNIVFILLNKIHLFSATRYIPQYAYFSLVAISIVIPVVMKNTLMKFDKKIVVIICLLLIAENYVQFTSQIPKTKLELIEEPEMYKFLSNLESRSGLVFLPISRNPHSVDDNFQKQYEYMYFAQYHDLRIFNGHTGFFPDKHLNGLNLLSQFPSIQSLNFLIKNNIKYIAVDKSLPGGNNIDLLKNNICESFNNLYSDKQYDLYRINIYKASECINNKYGAYSNILSFSPSNTTPHQIGKYYPGLNLMKSNNDEEGFLIYGPYVKLSTGEYVLNVKINALPKSLNSEIGFIDIAVSDVNRPLDIIQKVIIKNQSTPQDIKIKFKVTDPTLKYEFRVFSKGNGSIEVSELTLAQSK